tara:strand:- start:4 stop:213 length:210 start_codon:yes stop_codon:yes gene_type:complete
MEDLLLSYNIYSLKNISNYSSKEVFRALIIKKRTTNKELMNKVVMFDFKKEKEMRLVAMERLELSTSAL